MSNVEITETCQTVDIDDLETDTWYRGTLVGSNQYVLLSYDGEFLIAVIPSGILQAFTPDNCYLNVTDIRKLPTGTKITITV